jgi:hypothetical protein
VWQKYQTRLISNDYLQYMHHQVFKPAKFLQISF